MAPRRSDLHPVSAPGPAGLARLSSLRPPSLSLPLSLARSLTLSLPSAARCLALSPCALPEMSHYNGTSSTPHSLFSSPTAPHHVDRLTSTLDSTLLGGALEAAGEEAGTRRRKRRGRGGGGRLAPLPALLAVVLTPATHPAQGRRAVVRVGTRGPRTRGALRPLVSLRIFSTPTSPPGRSALGLFHWRTLPKMVICVRGRECGFPRFRVTWRERDSLTRSRVRRGLPLLPIPTPKGRGTGRGPESGRAGTGSGF